MSREMPAAELVIMASAISAALAVMTAVVFLAEYRSNNPRPRPSERPEPALALNRSKGEPHDEKVQDDYGRLGLR